MLILISTNTLNMVLSLAEMSNGFVKFVTIFGADMSSSVHIDNKKKDILIL